MSIILKKIEESEDFDWTTNNNFIQLFRKQALASPDRVIIVAQDRSITYDELNRKSDAVAKHLRKQGVKAEHLVGLCSTLNADFIICMLGIIKSGGAYFPLDPNYDSDRLHYMLKDGNPFLILTESQFTHLFDNFNVTKIEKSLFSIDSEDTEFSLHPESLAYVIYTSGSTNKPKGVMVTHKSLLNIATAHRSYYPTDMRMLISGGVCFDASLLVIFHALINNEPLYLFNHSAEDDIDDLVEFIESHSIGFMISIPSHYLKLLQKDHSFPFLKCVSLTGENLPQSLCVLHKNLAPNALLYNEYGPTECAIGTTLAKIYDPKLKTIYPVTVGKPLPNTEVFILDQDLNRLPDGSKGEICVGGIGLAKGYLNKNTLTSEKFIDVKISGKDLIRLYRTGDMGRILPNGELEFLGRIDYCLQLRGKWINPGEIEYHISRCPDVDESAVVAEISPQGKKQLIAYITSKKKAGIALLRDYLKGCLTEDMIPSSIVQIDKFKLSPNGKIDRTALGCIYG